MSPGACKISTGGGGGGGGGTLRPVPWISPSAIAAVDSKHERTRAIKEHLKVFILICSFAGAKPN